MTFYDMSALFEDDRAAKGGGDYDKHAITLSKFFEERATREILGHLKKLGVGDKHNPVPLDVSAMRHIIGRQSVVYSNPADRRLAIGGIELEDDSSAMVTLGDVCERALYDATLEQVDELRNLYRNVALVFAESGPRRSVQLRIFEPFNIRRRVDPRAADTMDADEAVAFQLTAGDSEADPATALFELWLHQDDGGWQVFVVDGAGNQRGAQPYADADDRSPFGMTLPAMMIYDEPPRGRAYLPLSENRLSYAQNAAALVNDLVYLVKQEAHSTITISGDDDRNLPTDIGPGKVVGVPGDTTVGTISTNPKLNESAAMLDHVLRLWALSESLPADTFKTSSTVQTGQALKVQERPLAKRRRKQVALVAQDEARSYEKLAAVHNTFAAGWGVEHLPEDAEMRASASTTWQPVDPKELQEVVYKDMSIGAASIIDYRVMAHGETRRQAIRAYDRVQRDRVDYPVENQQNPAAVVDGGPHAATGPGGAQKVAGAMNPERETATEGASIVDAVRAVG